ncbi:MAG: LuxR C-terminal-related transcriptional regulator [Chloroflexota bacterium]
MSAPILATKLYTPPPRPELVSRPRLIDSLTDGLKRDQGFTRKLTLISAAAGFGKTTLASDWIACSKIPSTWLSLDEADNDPSRFLTYLGAAIQKIAPKAGKTLLAALQSPQPSNDELLTHLLNEVSTVEQPFVLVLDDYHVIENAIIDELLIFLIEHLPLQMHLVLTTREDPSLPLARYRARGQLTEIRAADLRFTPAEVTSFLNQMMGLHLSETEIVTLETRTEGWIAGLQLVALSLQGNKDKTQQIANFSGSHRFILDYLLEEVLENQAVDVRTFLLQTAILERFSGSLCDAVTEQENGQDVLDALERDNLFMVPLDDQREWYRYHHLFRDVLRAHLLKAQPDAVSTLHQRASRWYEQQTLLPEAIYHALVAQDFAQAAHLIELAWSIIHQSFQYATFIDWVNQLPIDFVYVRPVLSAAYAWTLMLHGKFSLAEEPLSAAERWLSLATNNKSQSQDIAGKMVVSNQLEFQHLPAAVANARTFQAQAADDIASTIRYAQQALDLLPEDDHVRRAIPTGLLGLAYWANGDLEAAYQALYASRISMQTTSSTSTTISGTNALAFIRATQGRLREAIDLYDQSLNLAFAQGEPAIRGTADLYIGLSGLYLEQGKLDLALQAVSKGETLGAQAASEAYQYYWRLARGRLQEAQGDFEGALGLFDEAEQVYTTSVIPDAQPIAACKARVWIKQGHLNQAQVWLRNRKLSVEDDLTYLLEFEHITLARLFIAQYRMDHQRSIVQQAINLLRRLQAAAKDGERKGSLIEILLLLALAYKEVDDINAAIASLHEALTIAQPEGYAGVFVAEAPAVTPLLQEASVQEIAPEFTGKLLTIIEARQRLAQLEPQPLIESPPQSLIEPLSPRELDVLRLFKTELSGPEIANELMIALSTVRSHTKNIYSKLNVKNRRAAVRRAIELELI